MTEHSEQVTFNELCEIEPRLKDLYREVKKDKTWRDKRDWNVWQQYKSQIENLVGWESSSTDSLLISPEAYDVAYQTIYKKLYEEGLNDEK